MIGRREFLRLGAFGGVCSLADWMRLKASAPGGAARPARSLVVIFLQGGPPQLDTYDLKPSAPAEVRGEYKPIRTRVPGVHVCELLPKQAALMDRLAVVRSVVGSEGEHFESQVMTGWGSRQDPRGERPSVGAVISKLGKAGRPGVPRFVSLLGRRPALEPGFLGVAHRAYVPTEADSAALAGGEAARLERRRGLLGRLDGLDTYHRQAFDLITSGAVSKALNLGLEPRRVRERYGAATQLLTARRLVEAGVGCVTVTFGGGPGASEWDTHKDNFDIMDRLLPTFDHAVAAFAEDLHQRGLDKEVVVLMWGEMGRTPKINASAGRDHWGKVMPCVLWGGPLKGGVVVGSTDGWAAEAKERPVALQGVLATVYHALGIDPAAALPDRAGRPVYLLDEQEPIRELVG